MNLEKLPTSEEAAEFYNSNSDFKCYVDRYCKTYKVSKEVAFTHNLVLSMMNHYNV